jgi:hypothetical protein
VPKLLHCFFTDCDRLTRRHYYPNPSFPFFPSSLFPDERVQGYSRLSGVLHAIAAKPEPFHPPIKPFACAIPRSLRVTEYPEPGPRDP